MFLFRSAINFVRTVLKFNPLQDTKTMTKTIVHLMQGDVPGLVEDAIELGFLPEDVDKVGHFIAQCSHLNFTDLLHRPR